MKWHRFPKKEEKRQERISVISKGRENSFLEKEHDVCSSHYRDGEPTTTYANPSFLLTRNDELEETTLNHRILKRKVIWFNLQCSMNVETNIGKTLSNLVKKHFPRNNFCKIFNKNTIKISCIIYWYFVFSFLNFRLQENNVRSLLCLLGLGRRFSTEKIFSSASSSCHLSVCSVAFVYF